MLLVFQLMLQFLQMSAHRKCEGEKFAVYPSEIHSRNALFEIATASEPYIQYNPPDLSCKFLRLIQLSLKE